MFVLQVKVQHTIIENNTAYAEIFVMRKFLLNSPSALNGEIFSTQILCPALISTVDMATFTALVESSNYPPPRT